MMTASSRWWRSMEPVQIGMRRTRRPTRERSTSTWPSQARMNPNDLFENLDAHQQSRFLGEPRVKPEVASALRRLHANLGHPSQHDLTRHLRLAEAGPEVIQASKRFKLRCETCRRCTSAASARAATLQPGRGSRCIFGGRLDWQTV